MGLFDRIRGLFGGGQRALAPGLEVKDGIITTSNSLRGPPRRGTRELIASYKESPWLRAVVSRIGRGVASAGWTVYARASGPAPTRAAGVRVRQGPDGAYRDCSLPPAWAWGRDRGLADAYLADPDYRRRAARRRELADAGFLREVPDHPVLLVLANPNPHMSGRTALALTQTWLDIKGESFWWLTFDATGMPNGYLPIPPHWVTVPNSSSPNYRISAGGVQVEVKPEAMLWFRDPDPVDPYGRGTGVAESLGDELETDEWSAKYIKSWFYNSAMPSVIVAFEGADPKEVLRAGEKWNADHQGPSNAHRAHFSNGKMNAVRLDASFRDQQLIDLRKLSRDNVAQVFAMPPELIGIIENSNRSTIGAARYIYALGVEWPRVEFLRNELQRQLVSRWDAALVLEAEVSVPDDEERRAGLMKAMPGAFSLNEWRGEAGYAPLPEFEGKFPPLALPGQDGPPTQADAEDDADTTELEAGAEDEGEARKLALVSGEWPPRVSAP